MTLTLCVEAAAYRVGVGGMMMMMMMMMSEFVERRVINSPQVRYRSSKQVGLQMLSEGQRRESCGSQGGMVDCTR